MLIEKAKLTIDEYKKISKCRIGGRNQRYSDEYLILGKCVLLDVTSLYPYVMMYRDYPIGEKIYIDSIE